MIKKKQVIIMMSIAVLSFLVGTTFQFITMASDSGNPFDALESRIEALEAQAPPPGFLTAPAYDSGWMTLSPGGVICEHNLGTHELFVYVVGKWWDHNDLHQLLYGGIAYHYNDEWYNEGVWWYEVGIDQILVNRGTEDVRWDEVRVYIWVIP